MERPDRTMRLMLDGTTHLVDSFAQAPLIVFVCGSVRYPPQQPNEQMTWSALYPAAQNLIRRGRALGLGTIFTTLHRSAEPVVREVLGIPDDVTHRRHHPGRLAGGQVRARSTAGRSPT